MADKPSLRKMLHRVHEEILIKKDNGKSKPDLSRIPMKDPLSEIKTNSLLLLFQRPNEPLFTKKDNGKTSFDVPEDFLTDRYKPIGIGLQSRFGEDVEKRIPLRSVPHPDLSFATRIPIKGPFSLFNTLNKQIAGQLIQLFMDLPDEQSLLSTAAFVKDRVNVYLFQYALSVAMQHRTDTKSVSLPSIVQTFPDQFVDPSVFPKSREEGSLAEEDRMVIDIPQSYTASEKEIEQRMAYFREDIGVNIHHWHWHLVYPGEGPQEVVDKDRRGELFYYMHNQIIARYNVDRMSAGLSKVRPLNNFREPITEAYFPKIIRSSNNSAYPPRVSNTVMVDINRVDENNNVNEVHVGDLERWRDRIFEAIDKGFVVAPNGAQIPLDEVTGINTLGNIVEACSLSPNQQFYGSLHNEGHNVISFSHDPEGRYLEGYGVMGDVATAMRDPVFYRWHSFIDQVFLRLKNKQTPYQAAQHFAFNGINVQAVNVKIADNTKAPPNSLLTYWQRSDVDLAAGLDFGPEGNVYAQFTHLQHAPFNYHIDVDNKSGVTRRGTCRVFLAPKVDERGIALRFREQRTMMVEMDKFTVVLNPGLNRIRRRSDESTVTIPDERSLGRIGRNNSTTGEELADFQFCGCGWPQHMLLPKGSASGTQFDLFVMVSNFEDDTVFEEANTAYACNDAASFCGLKDQKYPDRRAMGFPFDRPHAVDSLAQFANLSSNMAVSTCVIRFVDQYVNRTA